MRRSDQLAEDPLQTLPRNAKPAEEAEEVDGRRPHARSYTLFPRSAWEHTPWTLGVRVAPQDAERPSLRSHAERGNEANEGPPIHGPRPTAIKCVDVEMYSTLSATIGVL
jgi:hypothetical protein